MGIGRLVGGRGARRQPRVAISSQLPTCVVPAEMIRYGAAPEFARSSIVTNRAHVLLWTDSSAAYLDAIKAAGLADRVAVDTLPRKDKPSADQLARTEALMAAPGPRGPVHALPSP